MTNQALANEFRAVTRGLSAAMCARAMNRTTSFVDWRGATKKSLARCWAIGSHGLDDAKMNDFITHLSRQVILSMQFQARKHIR